MKRISLPPEAAVYNARRRFESHAFIHDRAAASAYPLIVENTGNSIWGKGVRIERATMPITVFELVTAGDCSFMQNGRKHLVGRDMMFIQRKGSKISYETGPSGFLHKRWIGIQGAMHETLLDACGLLDRDVCAMPNPVPFVAAMKNAHRLLRAGDPGHCFELANLAFRTVLVVMREVSGPAYPAPIQAAIGLMHQHLDEPLSIPELAARAALSTPHFYRLFRQHVHDSPQRYYASIRLRSAADLLANTGKPIREIGLQYGYEEPAYFSLQFKKEFGVSPREYRGSVVKT